MENKFINSQGEVQINYLFDKLKGSFKFILAITMVTFVLVYSFSAQFSKPKYSNSITLIANYEGKLEDTGVDEINAARSLANIYETLIQSNDVMFAVINDLGLETNPADLGRSIDVSVKGNTPLIVIEYASKDADKVLSVLTSILETDVVRGIVETEQVSIVSAPSMETQITHQPSKIKNALILSVLAGILSSLIVFIKQLFNNKLHSSKQVQSLTNIPLLGLMNSVGNEDYLDLRTKLAYAMEKNKIKKVSILSPEKNKDLSSFIHTLAKEFSGISDKIAILELDQDHADVKGSFELMEDFAIKKTVTDYADLLLLTKSDLSRMTHKKNKLMSIQSLEDNYDYIFINAGSVNTDSSSLLLSQLSDASVLIVKKNVTKKEELYKSAMQLDSIENDILGLVFSR